MLKLFYYLFLYFKMKTADIETYTLIIINKNTFTDKSVFFVCLIFNYYY